MAAYQYGKQKSIFDKNLKVKYDISTSLFSYLFSEVIQYLTQKDDDKSFNEKLSNFGFPIGQRVLELCAFREKYKRCIKIVQILQFIQNYVWKLLFGKMAESIDQSPENPCEYRIYEHNPITNKFAAGKEEVYDCTGFVAGIIEGLLYSAEFEAKVTPFQYDEQGGIAYVIEFAKHVVDRDT